MQAMILVIKMIAHLGIINLAIAIAVGMGWDGVRAVGKKWEPFDGL
jgi:hypothetical protein